jgi:hypothetical protein
MNKKLIDPFSGSGLIVNENKKGVFARDSLKLAITKIAHRKLIPSVYALGRRSK